MYFQWVKKKHKKEDFYFYIFKIYLSSYFKFVINEGMQTLSKTLKKLDNKRESKT